MNTLRASELLGREVRFRGVRLGVVADLLVDPPSRRALGYVVACGDDVDRFLPTAASDVVEDHIDVESALVLLDDPFYRERMQGFRALRGTSVRRGSREVGVLRDLVVDGEGRLAAVVVDAGEGLTPMGLDDTVAFGPGVLRPAV